MPAASTAAATAAPPLVVPFSAMTDAHLALVGGKAHSLGTMRTAGFPVPDGFALTTEALRRFVEGGPLAKELEKIYAQVQGGGLSLNESWAFLGEVRKRIVEMPIPGEIQAALLEAYRGGLGPDAPVAVRSSGTKEDLEGASFAGQYETFLNVRGEAAVLDAVKRCWASIWRNRVLQYSARRAGGARDLWMSVVVQRMVEAEVSGVLFTVNPITGRERESLIEAVFGLGEALVSGKVNADRYIVDPASGAVLSSEVVAKERKVVPLADGETEQGATGGKVYTREVELTESAARKPTLAAADLAQLAELGAAIQEHYGRPMDVEWVLGRAAGAPAAAPRELFAVQARPITKLSFAPDFGEWTTADFKDGGVSSDVCSPFMWSLYEYALETSMPEYFKQIKLLAPEYQAKWGRMFFARPYWNLGEVKKILEKIPGYNEQNFDTDLGIEITYEGRGGKTTPISVGGVLGALPVLFALKKNYKERLAKDKAFVAAFEERKRPFDLEERELAALPRDAFAARFRELVATFYWETETSYFYTIYNTSNSKLDFKVNFDKAKKACGGELSYLDLVSGLENLSHMRPMADMHALCTRLRAEKRGLADADVRDFARRWRHHGRKELDIRVPRWRDDLAFVREMLEQALAAFDAAKSPEAQARAQNAQFTAARDKGAAALRWRPFARRAFLDGLELVRTYAWWREEMRDHSSQAYDLVRLWAVEAARRLVAEKVLEREDDIWHLTWQETLDTVDGKIAPEEARRRVRAGRRMVRSFRNFQNPNEIGNRYRFDDEGGPKAAAAGALRGTGCAPGRVEGRAKVVKKLEEAKKVEKGDVLVTIFTDPGWTPLLGMVSGVVTETGGLLSHAAVISREYGIPAVLAVPRATAEIKDGDTILVDGGAGTVEIKGRA
jgi:pyruvate,water dikinase